MYKCEISWGSHSKSDDDSNNVSTIANPEGRNWNHEEATVRESHVVSGPGSNISSLSRHSSSKDPKD